MNDVCIVAYFEAEGTTRQLVVGGFDNEAKARVYAARDETLRAAAEIQIAPYQAAAGVSQDPLFTLYHDGSYSEIFDMQDWFDEQLSHDDLTDCLTILAALARTGVYRWAEIDFHIHDRIEFTLAFRNLLATVIPTISDESERQDWQETLARLNEKTEQIAEQLKLTVSAEAHSDDWQREIEFDATRFFVQASDKELVDLVNCGFGGDYPADEVMLFFEETLPDVDNLLAYIRSDGNCGFEVHVDEQQANRWLARFRPQVLEQAAV